MISLFVQLKILIEPLTQRKIRSPTGWALQLDCDPETVLSLVSEVAGEILSLFTLE